MTPLDIAELEDRVADLRAKLAACEKERDALKLEVDGWCDTADTWAARWNTARHHADRWKRLAKLYWAALNAEYGAAVIAHWQHERASAKGEG